jgi:hypothetical protein
LTEQRASFSATTVQNVHEDADHQKYGRGGQHDTAPEHANHHIVIHTG